jgi:glycine cleavage system regulatory protein
LFVNTVNSKNYLDPTINRNINKIELDIYRKPSNADITIQYTSNHPQDHKQAAFTFYINRMLTLPITDQAKKGMGKNTQHSPKKWFPYKHNSQHKKERNSQTRGKTGQKRGTANKTNRIKKWIIVTYHSPLIRKVTNLFKNTNIKIAFRATNTVYQQLVQKTQHEPKWSI